MKTRIFMVLGMHRSGTSLVTSALQTVGIGLGSSLYPAGPDNPKGFWEDRDCLEISEALLVLVGSAYDQPGFAWTEFPSTEAFEKLKSQAIDVVGRKLRENGGTWGFKDPRACRFIAFWQEVFRVLDADAFYILAIRNPKSVAQSLEARNAIPREQSYVLWLQHVMPAVEQTIGQKRLAVDYDRFIEKPIVQLQRLAASIGADLTEDDYESFQRFCDEDVDGELRHSEFTREDVLNDPGAPALVWPLYELLREASADEIDLDGVAFSRRFKALKKKIADVLPLMNYSNALERDRRELWRKSEAFEKAFDGEASRSEKVAAENEKELGELRVSLGSALEKIEHHREHQAYLETTLRDRQDQWDAFERDQHAPLVNKYRDLEKVSQKDSEKIAELHALLSKASKDASRYLARCKTLARTAKEARSAEADRSEAMFAKLAAAENRLLKEKEAATGLRGSIQKSYVQIEAHNRENGALAAIKLALEQREKDLEREIAQILSSRSWTVTKPLRLINRLISKAIRFLIGCVERVLHFMWRGVPGRADRKTRFKAKLFSAFPSVFGWSRAYRNWRLMEASNVLAAPVSQWDAPAQVSDVYVPMTRIGPPQDVSTRLIAFYLPQFHAIAENDEWWGKGFTEWTNVKPARPQFKGHYQPHVPDELGYYNLVSGDTMRRQIELAKLYGFGGFCFYYYWFGGTRLLERPIERLLADETLDFPFCICWANENWSRRWDGKESEILIAQQHSEEDDLQLAEDLARYTRDPRYIRVNGKPLIVVYRPNLLPSAKATSDRWRDWFRSNGCGEIYLAYTQSFETEDPEVYGFDAAIEFPPNNSAPPNITDQVESPLPNFQGTVYDWSVFVKRSESYTDPGYKIYRSVCPSWDNTARRKNQATIFLNSEPAAYEKWLKNAVANTARNAASKDEQIVFVNAWNEWAEGAHVEPDRHYGYAWLEASRRAISQEPPGPLRHKVAIVTHDAHPHGAQFLALGLVRSFALDMKFDVHTVVLQDGRLIGDFARHSTVHAVTAEDDPAERLSGIAKALRRAGVRHALVNTTASGHFVEYLAREGITCVTLVHELPGVIEAHGLQSSALAVAQHADKIVFPAERVASGFERFAKVPAEKSVIRPQGVWRRNSYRTEKDTIRRKVRKELNAADNAPMVLSVGYGDYRKAPDIFARVGLQILQRFPDAVLVWIGHWEPGMQEEVADIVGERAPSFHFLGYNPDTARYHVAADVYALTSREDPFPNVVLESFDAAVPVVAFAETGGAADLVSEVGGRVVAKDDEQAFAAAVIELIGQPSLAAGLGKAGARCVDDRFAFREYVFDLCDLMGIQIPRVSVVVPNFNYQNFIRDRLDTIIDQTVPIFELILLDDASTDDSLRVIQEWMKERQFECRLVVNDKNSGSVFSQWKRGYELAKGDYLWIAEADDLSRAEFLDGVLATLERDSDVALSYCDSQQIDSSGRMLATNYKDYLKDLSVDRWDVPFTTAGKSEVENYLFLKNTIPNVSAVLFRRSAIHRVFETHAERIGEFKIAGDWLVYALVLKSGKISFTPRSANLHRRHDQSVVGSNRRSRILEEIAGVQTIIHKEFDLNEERRSRAAQYLDGLKRQLA